MYQLRKLGYLITLLIIIAQIMGCTILSKTHEEEISDANFLENIKIEMVDESIVPDGIAYKFILKNESEQVIVQNNVYVSFPITNIEKSQFLMNKCKVEAMGNKINIEPGDEIMLSAFMPKENFQDNNLICSEKPQLEFKGYINELDEMNHFEMSGDISYFDPDFKTRLD